MLGLFQAGTSTTLEQTLGRCDVDIAAFQEIRWRDAEIVNLNEYLLINSGNKANILGTGFIIKNTIKNAIIGYEVVNERICKLRLRGKFHNISMISVHAPLEDEEEEIKDIFLYIATMGEHSNRGISSWFPGRPIHNRSYILHQAGFGKIVQIQPGFTPSFYRFQSSLCQHRQRSADKCFDNF